MDRETWQATVHEVAKSGIQQSDFHIFFFFSDMDILSSFTKTQQVAVS